MLFIQPLLAKIISSQIKLTYTYKYLFLHETTPCISCSFVFLLSMLHAFLHETALNFRAWRLCMSMRCDEYACHSHPSLCRPSDVAGA